MNLRNLSTNEIMDHEVQHHRQLQCWLMAEIQCGIWNWRAVRSNWLNWIKADFSDDYQQVYCWGKSFCQSNWIGSPTRKTWRITWMICVGSWNHCSLDEWIEINYLLYTILCYMYFLFFFLCWPQPQATSACLAEITTCWSEPNKLKFIFGDHL